MPDIAGTPILETPVAEGFKDQHMVLNMGPQHPSTHGVLRLVLEIDGEIVVRMYPEIGYLHTGIEKTCEAKFYQQVVPLTDRIDYLGPMGDRYISAFNLAVGRLVISDPDRDPVHFCLSLDFQRQLCRLGQGLKRKERAAMANVSLIDIEKRFGAHVVIPRSILKSLTARSWCSSGRRDAARPRRST